ncbi:bifunctional NAD(P)H-hydrate repair enzyme [Gemmatimonadetes bacterium T265]|nr:bifunctional NAD(P)H-hydrate repair enzyme [Gemmatimonadetes bacterium T265]
MGAPAVRVTTATEAAAADAATIAAGVPSRALMQRAGAAAAAEIVRRYAALLGAGVAVHAGPGNNGGDAWVVARALRRYGVRVGVTQWGAPAPTTDDARYEHDRARDAGDVPAPTGAERVVVDGVLGTGARAPARDYAEAYAAELARARDAAAPNARRVVVALDVPTGLDATTGAAIGTAVRADLTLVFGTLKRGLLVDRDAAGEIAVLDIGLDDVAFAPPGRASLPTLVTADAFSADVLRSFPADAHKGVRGKVAVVGGAAGMAGAAALASDAALRSGAGMVRAVVAPESVPILQNGLHAAMATAWPAPDDADTLQHAVLDWADAILLGPGLGRSDAAAALLERVLSAWRGPVVVDADALNHYAGRLGALGALLAGRPALLTPHPLELARLLGTTVDDVLARRFEIAGEAARTAHAAVLLKGVPTVVSDGAATLVSATGTPTLGTAGSGDVLGGIAAALLAHTPVDETALLRGAAAAWTHGRAGELATALRGGVRGATLADVLDALRDAWPRDGTAESRAPYPVIAELPRVVG